MIKFSEVASLYLKCKCRIDGEKIGRFSGLDYSQFDDSITMITIHFSDDMDDPEHNWVVYNDDENLGRIKPILRPLSDLTKGEEHDIHSELGFWHTSDRQEQVRREAARTLWYLKKSFDIFELIPNNEAIDATTLRGGDQLIHGADLS